MDNFIFSLNVTIPIFVIILLGYILRNINFISEEFTIDVNKFVFNVALPVTLFVDIAATDIKKDMDIKFFFFCLIGTIFMFLLVWFIGWLTLKDKTMIGAFAQGSARGSAAILGIAFVENICGEIGMAPLMIVAAVPFFNILSVVILVFNAKTSNKDYGRIKSSCINVAKNPIIIAILLGLIVSLIGFDMPKIIDKSLSYIAATATPLALIAVGAGFDTKQAIVRLKPTFGATFIKLVGLPALFMPAAYKMGFGSSEMVAILIMVASPTTVSSYIMAKNMDNDDILASNIIVLSTLFSSVSLTLWIFILRSLGCI